MDAEFPFLAERPAQEPSLEEGPLDALADDELHRAFHEAETDTSEMIDANSVVEEAILQQDFDDDLADDFVSDLSPVFATETMATLLEEQGDAAAAEGIRASVDQAIRGDDGPSAPAEPMHAAEVPQ